MIVARFRPIYRSDPGRGKKHRQEASSIINHEFVTRDFRDDDDNNNNNKRRRYRFASQFSQRRRRPE